MVEGIPKEKLTLHMSLQDSDLLCSKHADSDNLVRGKNILYQDFILNFNLT